MSTTRLGNRQDLDKALGLLGIQRSIPQQIPVNTPNLQQSVIMRPAEDDDELISLESIIENKPPTKIVRDFFRDNLEELEEMTD